MKLIVFSTEERGASEIKDVIQMFEEGLENFHIKKKGFGKSEIEEYLSMIPVKFHNRIVLHSSHVLKSKFNVGGIHLSRTHRKKKYNSWWKLLRLKFFNRNLILTRTHSKLSSLVDDKSKFDYVFLSPIYPNISKEGHAGNFGNRSLEKYLGMCKTPVIALGGIDSDKIAECKGLGFDGVAFLGYIWNNPEMNPVDAFIQAQKIVNSNG